MQIQPTLHQNVSLWHISLWSNFVFHALKRGCVFAWPWFDFIANVILCRLSLERCCRHGEVTWQLRKTCTDKPFLCQALHIIMNSIIVAPQADKMKNISHKNNLSTNNILWATTYRLPILPVFYLIYNDWMFFLACLFLNFRYIIFLLLKHEHHQHLDIQMISILLSFQLVT